MTSRSPRSGRPPKPTHLRVIEGNPGKRALPVEKKPPPSRPRCPDWLTKEAKAEWGRVVPVLDTLGVLSIVDRSSLAAYCESVSTFKAATEKVKAGILVKGQKGEAVKNPALQVQRDAAKNIAAFSAMFGLSPADRVRLVGDAGAGRLGPELGDVIGSK